MPSPREASAYYLGGSLLYHSASSGTIEAYVDPRGVVNITVTDVGVGEESAIQFLDAQLACRLP